MKNLRRNFERFCFANRNKGIPNLMLYISIGAAIVYFLGLMNGGDVVYSLLCFDKALILKGQVWRLVTYVLTYSIGGSPLLVLLSLYCYYSLGRSVESSWGTFRFNLFYLTGVVLMDVFAMIFCPLEPVLYSLGGQDFLYPAEAFQGFYASKMSYYLNLTLLISFATLYPDAQFMILFVIPVKAWVMGLLYLVLNAIEIFNMCYPLFMFPHCFFTLVCFGNYLLFFGKDIKNLLPLTWRAKLNRRGHVKKASPKSGPIPLRTDAKRSAPVTYNRRCTVCGRTDTENPDLEFRFCSRCNGYHCYCQDHISNHEHIQ